MIPARAPLQRPADAKLLAIDAHGRMRHELRSRFTRLLRRGDLLIANDAMTLPASLRGSHERTGRAIEVRLAQRASLEPDDVRDFLVVVLGEGDHRMRTEDRPLPPAMQPGDRLLLGPLVAVVREVRIGPRLLSIAFEGKTGDVWAGIAEYGQPIQYAYMREPLALWDVWTPFAAAPAAFEPPSAGFVLDWQALSQLREAGVGFSTITHAAGISSTGDAAIDALLPFDEPYRIPARTAQLAAGTRRRGGRIVAVGTTVVRALEAAAGRDGGLQAGSGMATQRIGAHSKLRIVDAVLSGTHEPGTSHYEQLRAFTDGSTLRQADWMLESHGYRTHEFGDSVFVERHVAPASGRTCQQAHAHR